MHRLLSRQAWGVIIVWGGEVLNFVWPIWGFLLLCKQIRYLSLNKNCVQLTCIKVGSEQRCMFSFSYKAGKKVQQINCMKTGAVLDELWHLKYLKCWWTHPHKFLTTKTKRNVLFCGNCKHVLLVQGGDKNTKEDWFGIFDVSPFVVLFVHLLGLYYYAMW